MSEQAPNSNPELDAQVQEAIAATGEQPWDLGSATGQVTRLESSGDVVSGPFVQRVTKLENTPGEGTGSVISVDVNAKSEKWDREGTDMTFQSNTAGVFNSKTGQNEYAKITRRTADGQEYEHRFRDPKTAEKFGKLIAKQVTQRAETAGSEQNKAA